MGEDLQLHVGPLAGKNERLAPEFRELASVLSGENAA